MGIQKRVVVVGRDSAFRWVVDEVRRRIRGQVADSLRFEPGIDKVADDRVAITMTIIIVACVVVVVR